MARILLIIMSLLFSAGSLRAEAPIEIFPGSPYDQSTIYLNLGIFWAALIVLIVLIKLKLREIERVQAMEKEQDDADTPTLD